MENNEKENNEKQLLNLIGKLLNLIVCILVMAGILIYVSINGIPKFFIPDEDLKLRSQKESSIVNMDALKSNYWIAPDSSLIPNDELGTEIRYGKMLIVNTAFYFGPYGSISKTSNGMNCQNCHLEAGTKIFGNNFSAVASTYPKFRGRSGRIENIYKRVNDCFERSLNGVGLDTLTREMHAIKSYILWLGKGVKKGVQPMGSGLSELKYMSRAANCNIGKSIYISKCLNCHGKNGEGKMNADKISFQYPALWGEHSYNSGAGLFRLSRFAGYVKSNMPVGANAQNPQLTDEEAWDVAAFVNSQNRPNKDLRNDWPKIAAKPIDHPFGPYADSFTEIQHKYGPFEPIAAFNKSQKNK